MMEAVIFVGFPGSGKSTFFRENFSDTHIRLNLDMLRTRKRETILFEACLAAKQSFVVDNTNVTLQDRERYIPAAKAAHFRLIAYWFDIGFGESLDRNAAREGKARVPLGAMNAFLKKIVPPTCKEGFHEVRRVILTEEGGFHVC